MFFSKKFVLLLISSLVYKLMFKRHFEQFFPVAGMQIWFWSWPMLLSDFPVLADAQSCLAPNNGRFPSSHIFS